MSLVEELRDLTSALDTEDVLLHIYDVVDNLLRSSAFDECDALLKGDFVDLPSIYSLAMLSITGPARDKLPTRASFAERLRERLTREDPSRVDDLLLGLE